LNENDNGNANLFLIAGYSTRRLVGDYGLDSNAAARESFIGTDELEFSSFNLGARIEVSNFYGQINLTNFGEDDIPGFSGNQAVISVGFNANLYLKKSRK
jgi:hypothetical protein